MPVIAGDVIVALPLDAEPLGLPESPGPADLRESEVEHLYRAVAANFDVGGLQIAMDDAGIVRGLERIDDLADDWEACLACGAWRRARSR